MATSESLLSRLYPYKDDALVSKPARTMMLVLLLALTPLVLPGLQQKLPLKGKSYWEILPSAREFVSFKRNSASATLLNAPEETTSESISLKPSIDECSDQLIEDPEHTMDLFNNSLKRTEAREAHAITRISHYGDSPITNDGITGTVRQLLQERFGDSGHGFILIDRPWDWYGHQAINFDSGGGWTNGSLMDPQTRDGELGFGGVAFFSRGSGSFARFEPVRDGPIGKKFTRMEVFYLEQPGGGQFSIRANDQNEVVSTAGTEPKSGFREIKVSGNQNNGSFEVKTIDGDVRLFGAVLENDDSGVVYDSLGVNGAFAGLLATAMNEQHWTEQLQHRRSNLVILNYGTNESQYASDDQMQRYDRELREVVRRVRTALPEASILIVSPMDRGKRAPGGKVITQPSIPKIVEMQRRVAKETHCAFLNLFAAMGGEGTMARWHEGRKHLVGADLTHPNAEGSQTVGTLIYMALMENYDNYRDRSSRKHLQAKAENTIR